MFRLRTIVLLLSALLVTRASADAEVVDGDIDAEVERLISRVLPRAKRDIRLHGGFLPFGGALKSNGQIGLVGGEKPEKPEDLEEVALDVALSLRVLARDDETRAICLAVLVHTAPPGKTEKVDAIWIRVEHRSGLSKSLFHPYELLDTGHLRSGTPFVIRETREFFGAE